MAEKREARGFWEMLERLDPRFFYWLILVLLAIPNLVPLMLPIKVSDSARDAFALDDRLTEKDVVLYFVEGSSGMWPEVLPSMIAVTNHFYQRHVKFVIIAGGWSIDHMLTMDKVWDAVGHPEKHGYKYGEDWAYFGFFPGLETGFAAMARDFRSVYKEDYYGNPIDTLPIMKDRNSGKDFSAVWAWVYGGGHWWIIKHINIPYGTPVLTAIVGPGIPDIETWYRGGQCAGYLGSTRGAAEYEILLKAPGTGLSRMDALNVGFIFAVIFMIIGNIHMAVKKRRGGA